MNTDWTGSLRDRGAHSGATMIKWMACRLLTSMPSRSQEIAVRQAPPVLQEPHKSLAHRPVASHKHRDSRSCKSCPAVPAFRVPERETAAWTLPDSPSSTRCRYGTSMALLATIARCQPAACLRAIPWERHSMDARRKDSSIGTWSDPSQPRLDDTESDLTKLCWDLAAPHAHRSFIKKLLKTLTWFSFLMRRCFIYRRVCILLHSIWLISAQKRWRISLRCSFVVSYPIFYLLNYVCLYGMSLLFPYYAINIK